VTDHAERLAAGAAHILGRPLAAGQLAAFEKYLDLLRKWNKSQRLIGSDDPAWIIDNLFLDSLLFLHVLSTEVSAVADLGSGAGIPGIPLKIVKPEWQMTLIESRARRTSFLAAVVRDLRLDNVHLVRGRAEEHMAELEGRFDAVVMRCAGPPEIALAIARRLVRHGGTVVATAAPGPPAAEGHVRSVPGREPGAVRHFVVVP
jgi:16S rRNA (guanine527-N7)-methyltransferase